MRTAMILVLLAAVPATAVETTLATGVVKKVEMGYQWVGWVLVEVNKYSDGGVQPQLKVTMADGTQWSSCFSSPIVDKSCLTTTYAGGYSPADSNYFPCMLVEYSLKQKENLGNNAQNQLVRKLNPQLAMLSMAGLKALTVQLKDLGGHPDFVQAKCFDSVVVCFGGTCN